MLSPKSGFNSPGPMAQSPLRGNLTPMTNSTSAKPQSPVDMELDTTVKEDQLEKLRQIEIIPELFAILHDLQVGKLLAKDFDNKLGSIRLKLSNMKQYLRDIPGITETIEARHDKIKLLQENNEKKFQLIEKFTQQVNNIE